MRAYYCSHFFCMWGEVNSGDGYHFDTKLSIILMLWSYILMLNLDKFKHHFEALELHFDAHFYLMRASF